MIAETAIGHSDPDAVASLTKRDNPVAVTVRLDQGRYERLKLYGLARRLTNQEILVRALDHLLAEEGPRHDASSLSVADIPVANKPPPRE